LSLNVKFSIGQIEQSGRFEVAISSEDNSQFAVASAGEDGLIIHNRIVRPKLDKLEIIQLDTTLNEIWRGQINLAKDLEQVKSIVKD